MTWVEFKDKDGDPIFVNADEVTCVAATHAPGGKGFWACVYHGNSYHAVQVTPQEAVAALNEAVYGSRKRVRTKKQKGTKPCS